MRGRIYGIAAVLSLISAGVVAADTQMVLTDRALFGAEVRAYLLENPEVLEEARQVLEERRAAAAAERDAQLVADHLETLYDDPMSPVLGNPEGTLTVVKFNDFNCGHCRATAPDLSRFLEQNPDTRLIIKEFPVLGPRSVIAASFAVTIWDLGGPEAYETVKERLFAGGPEPDAQALRDLASEVGVDPDEMTARMGSEEVRAHLQRNVDLAAALDIKGTPGLIFEDLIIRGRIPYEVMTQIRGHLDTR
jgi:protein-disulfide isomerase